MSAADHNFLRREAARQGRSDGKHGYPRNPGDFIGAERAAYIQAHADATEAR